MKDISQLIANTRIRLAIASFILIGLISSSFLLINKMLDIQSKDAELINVAGRQRMLSQKIALMIIHQKSDIQLPAKDFIHAEPLQVAAREMFDNHKLLTGSFLLSEELKDIYFNVDSNLDARVTRFTLIAQEIAKARTVDDWMFLEPKLFSEAMLDRLLNDLDRAVSQFELEANNKFEEFRKAKIIIWACVITLLLVTIYFFLTSLEKTMHRFFVRNAELTQRLDEEQQNSLIFSNFSSDAFWQWDVINKKVNFSKRWMSMRGYSAEELSNNEEEWSSRIHPDDQERVYSAIRRHFAGESDEFQEEYRSLHKDGSWLWVLDRGIAYKNRNGQVMSMVGTEIDLTERRRQEVEQKAETERLTLAADSAGIGIWDLNLQTNELHWDKWMIRLYGLDEHTFTGAYDAWENGLHPEDIERAAAELQTAIGGGKKFDTEFRVVQPDGKVRFIKAAATVLRDDAGEAVRMVGINYDKTKTKEAESKLIEAKLAAEEATRTKSEFLASMSHEIRTPMNGILGMLGLLLNTQLTDEQIHRVKLAQSSAKSLLTLINDILDFSKIDANKLDFEMLSFNLCNMLGECAESLAQQAQGKGVELNLDMVDVNKKFVVSDPSRIRQIVTNLTNNAIKFTEHGEVTISATLHTHSPGQDMLEMRVTDTGIGIAEEKQEKIFNAFCQVDSSTTRHYGGTGLGLAIVKNLSERFGGTITLSSQLGQGSTFCSKVLVGEANHYEPLLPKAKPTPFRVLIVDNNLTNREILSRQFRKWGAIVRAVASTQETIQILMSDEAPFTMILIDKLISDTDGITLGQELTSAFTLRDTHLILMTPITYLADCEDLARKGFTAYFPKPATMLNLFDLVHLVSSIDSKPKLAKALVTEHHNPSLSPEKRAKQHDSVEQYRNAENKKHILLVEDNPVNQEVALGILEGMNVTVTIAVNGLEAVECLQRMPLDAACDLILMDCQMPEMDGYESTKLIRQGVAGLHYKDTPIVAMTANAMLGDREKCLAVGMNDYLSKPISAELLQTKLDEWLNHLDTEAVNGISQNEKKIQVPVWDHDDALYRLRGKRERLDHILLSIVQENKDNFIQLDQIQVAIDKEDFSTVANLAHGLKGMAGNLSAMQLLESADQMEAAAKAQDKGILIKLLPKLETAGSQFLQAISRHLSAEVT